MDSSVRFKSVFSHNKRTLSVGTLNANLTFPVRTCNVPTSNVHRVIEPVEESHRVRAEHSHDDAPLKRRGYIQ